MKSKVSIQVQNIAGFCGQVIFLRLPIFPFSDCIAFSDNLRKFGTQKYVNTDVLLQSVESIIKVLFFLWFVGWQNKADQKIALRYFSIFSPNIFLSNCCELNA